mmetsp:Transcript_4898/g.10821  ORF Transcript_4898/g.10821 Transcript_4898/m.10821 type:complete len:348 (-) Transcript_4898:1141-2184(-)
MVSAAQQFHRPPGHLDLRCGDSTDQLRDCSRPVGCLPHEALHHLLQHVPCGACPCRCRDSLAQGAIQSPQSNFDQRLGDSDHRLLHCSRHHHHRPFPVPVAPKWALDRPQLPEHRVLDLQSSHHNDDLVVLFDADPCGLFGRSLLGGSAVPLPSEPSRCQLSEVFSLLAAEVQGQGLLVCSCGHCKGLLSCFDRSHAQYLLWLLLGELGLECELLRDSNDASVAGWSCECAGCGADSCVDHLALPRSARGGGAAGLAAHAVLGVRRWLEHSLGCHAHRRHRALRARPLLPHEEVPVLLVPLQGAGRGLREASQDDVPRSREAPSQCLLRQRQPRQPRRLVHLCAQGH